MKYYMEVVVMTIVRWRPTGFLSEMGRLDDTFDKLFGNNLLGDTDSGAAARGWAPALDVYEEEGSVVVKAEVPGMAKDDIAIEVKNDILTIRGEKKVETEEKNRRYYRSERRYGSFTRSFYLPEDADTDNIKASYKEGLLELRIPKIEKKEEEDVKKIAVD